MIRIKPGVNLLGIRTEMLFAHSIVSSIYLYLGYECILTSGVEGTHSPHSHHYKGLALDYRLRHIPDEYWDELVSELKSRLSHQFQVVLNKDVPVLHIEFDPKC